MISEQPYHCTPEPQMIHARGRGITEVWVTNEGKADARLGSHHVTMNSGAMLGPGMMLILDTAAELDQEWWVASEGTTICVTVLT